MASAFEIQGVTIRLGSSDSYNFEHCGHSFRLDEVGVFFELWRLGVDVNGSNKLVCRLPRILVAPEYLSKILHLSAEAQVFSEQLFHNFQ